MLLQKLGQHRRFEQACPFPAIQTIKLTHQLHLLVVVYGQSEGQFGQVIIHFLILSQHIFRQPFGLGCRGALVPPLRDSTPSWRTTAQSAHTFILCRVFLRRLLQASWLSLVILSFHFLFQTFNFLIFFISLFLGSVVELWWHFIAIVRPSLKHLHQLRLFIFISYIGFNKIKTFFSTFHRIGSIL